MNQRTHGASRIKTLRLALGPGASTFAQLAAVLAGRGAGRSGRMSLAGFLFPYVPGFPALALPGRRPQAPAFVRRRSMSY